MKKHSHEFVESYTGAGAYGLDRKTDEETIVFYLQKFSDDRLIKHLITRMTAAELDEIYALVNRIMKAHLTKDEYADLFLKDDHHHH